MSSYHNKQLNVVGLFDYDDPTSAMFASATSDYSGIINGANAYLHGHENAPQVTYGFGCHPVEPERFIASTSGNQDQERKDKAKSKTEVKKHSVSYTPSHGSDDGESAGEDVSPGKAPKLNKDGAPRKPRQPRPKLLKWTDNDWKNVVLGIIWACGEQGVHIPFGQAAKVVGENCTAGALQQAVLKLRGKQIAEGHPIPILRMPWQRKDRNGRSSTPIANAKSAQVEAKSKAKSPVLKRAVHKVNSLVVKLKLGRRGITKKQPKAHVLPKKQSEVYALPMKDMQPDTSMLSMNGINGMQAGAHMLQTNNMQAGGFMLPGNNIQVGGITLPGNSMPAGGYTLPGNNPFPYTSTPAYGAHAHQFSYLGQLQGTQPPQSLSPEEKHYNRNHVVCNSFLHDEFNAIKATVGRDLSPEAKQFHRNHTIVDGFMFDEYNRVRATDEELRPLEHITTPESDPFHSGYTSENLSDPHSQAQGLLDLPEDDFIDFSSFIDYSAHLASH